MKISTKGRYALRLMLDLAVNNTGEYIPLKTVSERQEISVKYLEQIITTLVKAGFVKGLRGSKGGYKLAKEPDEYTVGMILRLTEGSLAPVACLDDEVNTCDRCDDCITLELWKQLYSAINNVVDNITLADLIEKYNSKIGNDYNI
ncbi:MAG: Rrf2 family transcriptional regulator [Lachnospirales bacterium]